MSDVFIPAVGYGVVTAYPSLSASIEPIIAFRLSYPPNTNSFVMLSVVSPLGNIYRLYDDDEPGSLKKALVFPDGGAVTWDTAFACVEDFIRHAHRQYQRDEKNRRRRIQRSKAKRTA